MGLSDKLSGSRQNCGLALDGDGQLQVVVGSRVQISSSGWISLRDRGHCLIGISRNKEGRSVNELTQITKRKAR